MNIKIITTQNSALNETGFARVDIKSNESGNVFMDANLAPGMTLESSYFPEAFRVDGELSYDEVVSHTIDYCLPKETKAMQYTEAFHFEYDQD